MYNTFCEDIKHTLFSCFGAMEIWRKMGLKEVIKEACVVDRDGSAILEYLLDGKFSHTSHTSVANISNL